MVKKAIVIGINYLGTENELHGCINDSSNVRDLLISQYKFKSKNITLMTDKSQDPTLLPTMKNIIIQIRKLVSNVKSGDSIVFTYSGHGDQMPDRNKDEEDGLDETLVPLDFDKYGEISDDLLRQELVDKIPQGAKLTCIIDSCHSGTILDLKYTMVPQKNVKSKFIFSLNSKVSITKGDVICISGCKDDQVTI